jgi:hypothetical protein
MFKGKTSTGTPVTHTKFANAKGFDRADSKLGTDTIPGAAVGAPLMQNRTVDDYDAVKKFYRPGATPGNLNELASGVIGLEGNRPMAESVLPKAEMPVKSANSKAAEVEHADPTLGLGERPRGVMDR